LCHLAPTALVLLALLTAVGFADAASSLVISSATPARGDTATRASAGLERLQEGALGASPRAGLPSSIDLALDEQDATIYGARGSGVEDQSVSADRLGESLATGDFNGDGVGDLLVGAPDAGGPEAGLGGGEAYVVFGPPTTTDIAQGEQDVTIVGADTWDELGSSVAAGDLNNDGLDDIVVGAPGVGGSGTAYIIYGAEDLGGNVDISRGEQDVIIASAGGNDRLGTAVACGDLNGDGIDDLLVAARQAEGPDNARPLAGEVYAIFGSTTLASTIAVGLGEQDVTVFGADERDTLGWGLAAGDFNGDGFDDMLLATWGADGPDNTRPYAGDVYVVFGSPTLAGTVDTALSEQDVTIFGADESDGTYLSVAAGDLNGDGFDEILIGAPSGDGPGNARYEAGEAYVVYGSADLASTIDVALGEQDVTVFGTEEYDYLGGVVTAGDFDGDGLDDLLIGATCAGGPDNARTCAGEAHIVAGSTTLAATIDIAQGQNTVTIFGADDDDGLPGAATAGDVNGDWLDDILLSTPRADGPDELRSFAGEAYVIFGVGPAAPTATATPTASATPTVIGPTATSTPTTSPTVTATPVAAPIATPVLSPAVGPAKLPPTGTGIGSPSDVQPWWPVLLLEAAGLLAAASLIVCPRRW
jgi:hypothetical protein